MFLAGLCNVELVGSCERIEDPEAPVWSWVHLEYVEGIGGGTLAYDEETSELRHLDATTQPEPLRRPLADLRSLTTWTLREDLHRLHERGSTQIQRSEPSADG